MHLAAWLILYFRSPYADILNQTPMLITPLQLEKEPLLFDQSIPAGALEYAPDITQVGPVPVTGRADLVVEHRGHNHQVPDIRLRAAYKGEVDVLCARCVEPVRTPVAGSFDLIFRPAGADSDPGERSISADETEIGYYEQSGLSLEDVVREQVLLSLPSRTLCNEDCKGLCPRCGQNLNTGTCKCDPSTDPRWNALSGLASTVRSK
ncbi:MAG TPA: DUF177 domain-containing protein [Acidobacteriaceae bacterium]|nr:DUF177 domain-containing protein [Acidobacteriaceae bacterium]